MKQSLIFLLMTMMLFSQGEKLKFSEFRFGSLNPKDTDAGFYGSISSGSMFDANLGYNFEIGFFGKRYRKQTRVYVDSLQSTSVSTSLTQSTTMLPIMVKLNYIKDINSFLLIKFDLGLGYTLLWNNEENFETGTDKTRFFHGVTYQLGADAGIQISETGSIFGGVFWNGGSISGNHQEVNGLPTFDEKNMSGLGIRLTIRIDGLGLF